MKSVTIDAVGYNGPGQSRKLEIVQSQLKKAGIEMTVSISDVGASNQAFFVSHGPALYCSAWTGRPDPSDTYSGVVSPRSFYNAGGYAAPNAEGLIAAGKQDSGPAQRATAYKPLAKLVQDEMIFLPLSFRAAISAFQSSVKGYTPDLYGKPDVSFLWVDK